MTTSLRARQKAVAREAILMAAADEIVERGLGAFSLQAVAERAGVSTRTLYNYFPSREHLFRGLADLSEEATRAHGGWTTIRNLDDFPEAVETVWQSWEAQGTVYQALTRISAAEGEGIAEEFWAERRNRTERICELLTERRPDLSPVQLEVLAALVHTIMGAATWDRMKALTDSPADEAGVSVRWALKLLLEALDGGDDPWKS